VLEDLELADAKASTVKFINCAGEDSRPVLLQNCVLQSSTRSPTDVAIAFKGTRIKKGETRTILRNQAIHVENCRIEGPFRAAFEVDGAISNVEVSRNRITNVRYGLYVRRPETLEENLILSLTGNSFRGVNGQPNSAAIRFETAGPYLDPKNAGKNRLEVNKNYFGDTNLLVSCGDEKDLATIQSFLSVSGNTRDAKSREGNPSLTAIQVDTPPPE
jgi:hypothetical protein